MFINQLYHGGILALYDWDNTIFDNMVLPQGIEKQLVVDEILYKYAETPLHTPDPEVIKFFIGQWSKRRLPLWERYYKLVNKEYDPLWNYDRTETKTIDYGKRIDYAGENKIEQDDVTTDEISADNSSLYQPDNQITLDGETKSEFSNNEQASGKDVESIRAFGNIGVTTVQQLVREEMEIISKLDVVDYIAQDWKSEFCLEMYN